SEQYWTTRGRRLGSVCVQEKRKHDCQQEESRQHRQSGLETSAVCHLNWPAYHSTSGTPKSKAAIAPSPRKTPNGNSICMFRSRCRSIKATPMIEPVKTPTKIVRIVSRQPR